MKVFIFWISSLILWPSIVFAQTYSRDAVIVSIESNYAKKAFVAPDSPLIEALLGPAKFANPGVSSDIWLDIKREVSTAISKIITEKGASLDRLLRGSLESFSDAELDRLHQILSDPVYDKFLRVMANSSAHDQYVQGMLADMPKFGPAVNSVLVRHALKEVH